MVPICQIQNMLLQSSISTNRFLKNIYFYQISIQYHVKLCQDQFQFINILSQFNTIQESLQITKLPNIWILKRQYTKVIILTYCVIIIIMITYKKTNQSNQEIGNLFLQMRLIKIQSTQQIEGPFRIAVFKGLQKIDETPIFHPQSQSQLVIDESFLNFHIINFKQEKNIVFTITLEFVEKIPPETYSFEIQANTFVMPYLKERVNTFSRTDTLRDDIQMEYMLFIENTKSQVDRSVKNYEQLKKSQKSGQIMNQWTVTSPSLSSQLPKKPIRHLNSQQILLNDHKSRSKKNSSSNFGLTASQNQQKQIFSQIQISQGSNKVWYQFQDGEQKVNNLIPRKRSQNLEMSITSSNVTHLKIFGGLFILGIVIYLVILLDDMNYGMNVVREVLNNELGGASVI